MRMWMVDPKIMCRKHLNGSHVEIHMFLGAIKKGTSMKGFINNNLLEAKSLKSYHDEIVDEMIFRGYRHNTKIDQDYFEECFNKLSNEYKNHKINKESSLKELITRCPECKLRKLDIDEINKHICPECKNVVDISKGHVMFPDTVYHHSCYPISTFAVAMFEDRG